MLSYAIVFSIRCPDLMHSEFPDIKFVEGTHGSPDEAEQFKQLARMMLTAPKNTLPVIVMSQMKK
jgi:hypothetical protein